MFEAPSSWTWWTKQSGGDRIKGMGRADEVASRSIRGREVPAKISGSFEELQVEYPLQEL